MNGDWTQPDGLDLKVRSSIYIDTFLDANGNYLLGLGSNSINSLCDSANPQYNFNQMQYYFYNESHSGLTYDILFQDNLGNLNINKFQRNYLL